jgi:hypothetical protein
MSVTPLLLAWFFAAAAPTDGAERVKPKLVTPAMVTAAESYVNLPLGTEVYGTVDGRDYVFVVERHYHPPGTIGAPNGWHNGVTMYELH